MPRAPGMRASARAQCHGQALYRHWQQQGDITRMTLMAVMGSSSVLVLLKAAESRRRTARGLSSIKTLARAPAPMSNVPHGEVRFIVRA